MKSHVSRWKTVPTNTPVWLRLLVKHHGDLATKSARSYFPPIISDEVWEIFHLHYFVYAEWPFLAYYEKVEVRHRSLCIRKNWSYFSLRGSNTCAKYDLQRLRNDLPLCFIQNLNWETCDIIGYSYHRYNRVLIH